MPPESFSSNRSVPRGDTEFFTLNALFFEPTDLRELEKQMELMVTDDRLKDKLCSHHEETLKRYSWKRCAEETLEVLNT